MQISIDCDTSISIFIKGFFIYVISLGLALQKYNSNRLLQKTNDAEILFLVLKMKQVAMSSVFYLKEKIIINLENIILT